MTTVFVPYTLTFPRRLNGQKDRQENQARSLRYERPLKTVSYQVVHGGLELAKLCLKNSEYRQSKTSIKASQHIWEMVRLLTINDQSHLYSLSYPPLDNIRVMVIVWRLRENIIRTALCWVVWQCSQSAANLYEQFLQVQQIGFVTLDPYVMHRGGCLELYYCNTVEWCWWDSSLIWKTNWFPSVLWHCWFGHMTCKNRSRYDL